MIYLRNANKQQRKGDKQKMERYIEEYANACKKKIEENDLMEPAVKNKITAKINAAVKLRYKQLITEDEAMKLILESKTAAI